MPNVIHSRLHTIQASSSSMACMHACMHGFVAFVFTVFCCCCCWILCCWILHFRIFGFSSLQFAVCTLHFLQFCSGTVRYGMLWCGMVWYGMAWYSMLCYGMAWYAMLCYGMVGYGIGIALPLHCFRTRKTKRTLNVRMSGACGSAVYGMPT